MTQSERQALENIVERLNEARLNAPIATTYKRGQTQNSVATEILEITRSVEKLLDDE